MTNQNLKALKPGEIRLDYIPLDWPLTPLGPNKDPYIQGWQNKPFSVREIEEELATGDARAIGLLGGPTYNHPYGLVWVDVDGASVSPSKTRCLPPLPSSVVKSAANASFTN
jgi:hypothetical protein